MRTIWENEQMESILLQLNQHSYPFKKFRFSENKEGGLVLLGTGGYANVYEMKKERDSGEQYAVKVLGFGEKRMKSEDFRNTVKIQKQLGFLSDFIVKTFDYIELLVHIDTVTNRVLQVEEVTKDTLIRQGSGWVHLQFILMEKLVPIFSMNKMKKPGLYPEALAHFEETEIIKLVHNIGMALNKMHSEQILHRDIKLENVFYDPKKKTYKLGDFGIAKMTNDGMAATVALTRGYGAPEVLGTVDTKYDNTADIYSFGVMLYLLLNDLKFPGSGNYHVNSSLQYSKGYVFPPPVHSDNRLCEILRKMCAYAPEDRYQSMEEALKVLEGVMFGDRVRYQAENQKAAYVMAMLCYLAGMVMWKLSCLPDLSFNLGFGAYSFLALGGLAYMMNLMKKNHTLTSIGLWCLGLILLWTTGFTWVKLLLMLCVVTSTGSGAGLVVVGILAVDMTSKLMHINPDLYQELRTYGWIAVLLFTFSLTLFMRYKVLKEHDLQTGRLYFQKHFYRIFILMMYGALLLNGLIARYMNLQFVVQIHAFRRWFQFVEDYHILQIGFFGVCCSIGWILREWVLRKKQEQ